MKLMVIDTQGPEGISPRYRALMPEVRLRGVEMAASVGSTCHPHGMMAGYYAGCLLHEAVTGMQPGVAELVFVRIFDGEARMLGDVDKWMIDVIGRERPAVITRSWGGTYSNDQFGKLTSEVMWNDFVVQYRKLQKEIGFVDFGSAGNSGDWWPDDDTGYPQRMMPDVCNIIGSCRRDGMPSEWSSDGPSVQCVAWGERIYLANNIGWELGSGTSFSCPKMAGLCAALGLSTEQWRELVATKASRPKGFEKARSNKWGQGNMEDEYQQLFRKLPPELLPPSGPAKLKTFGLAERWFDFERITA